LLIDDSTDHEHGVINLWKRGKSGGHRLYPDFGKYMELETFQYFYSAAAFA